MAYRLRKNVSTASSPAPPATPDSWRASSPGEDAEPPAPRIAPLSNEAARFLDAPHDLHIPGEVEVANSRGVQIGDRNVQVNTYAFTVTEVDLDLRAALERPAVRRALSELAADPDDAGRRHAADRALGRGAFFAHHPRVRTTPGEVRTQQSATWFGVILLRQSRGVQVGDGGRQENHFAYVTTAALDGRRLLQESAELRQAIVDACCEQEAGVHPDRISAPLAEAADDALLGHVESRRSSTSATPRPFTRVVVSDADGVSVGRSCRQHEETSLVSRDTALARVEDELEDFELDEDLDLDDDIDIDID